MMWVCRPGKHSCYYDQVINNSELFLGWEGYDTDLSVLNRLDEFRSLVISEKDPDAPTTISNWAGQLYSFCLAMKVDDYVLIPAQSSRFYTLAILTGEYEYKKGAEFPHTRKIRILKQRIDRDLFMKSMQYSLGAFRTVFKVKQEDEVLRVANIK